MLNKLKKIGKFLSSKIFLTILIIVLLILICVLFWIYSPLISYNETRIFGNQYVRVVIIIVLWLIIFFAFLFKRIKTFILSLNNQRHKKVQTLKSDAKDFFHKTKRNFIIALKDAKDTWKRDIHFKDIPVVMLIGSEGSGKSTLINYSNIEYPITDSLGSYKKYHLPTKNFGFYISKEGVLIDTEGSFFTLEDSFKPQNTDELPEDDIDRNKDYLFKKMIWKSFLKFLNKRRFYKKLNGIILVIDLYALLNQSKDSFINDLRYLVKRVSECERTLNMQLPVYVIFTKLDLVEGMGDFLKLYGEGISEKALGITVPKNTKITEIYLKEKFEEIITSFKHSLMAKNHINHDIDDKAKSYLFLKQLENIFAVLTEFMSRLSNENSLKNRSFIRGVYITSAYQENVPHNFMSEAVCHKYSIQTPMAKISGGLQKQSYFVSSLIKDIIFTDKGLSRPIFGGSWKKISVVVAALCIFGVTYLICAYFVNQRKLNIATLEKDTATTKVVVDAIKTGYNGATLVTKAEYVQKLRNILSYYPPLLDKGSYLDYPNLNVAFMGMRPVKALYLQGADDVLSQTLTVELEKVLSNEENEDKLIQALYMYKSLFERKYLNKELLKLWVKNNWGKLIKYGIPQHLMLTYIDDLQTKNTLNPKIASDYELILNARKILSRYTHAQRLYSLLAFSAYHGENEMYSIRDAIGGPFDDIFDTSTNFYSIPKAYTIYGIDNILININAYIEDTAKIESWLLGKVSDVNDEHNNKAALSLDVIRLYLQEYQQEWQKVLENIKPQKFSGNEFGLNILSIMSKSNNPIFSLVDIVSKNTDLLDSSILKTVAKLGFPTLEIKNSLVTLNDAFGPYHKIAKEDSFFNKGIDAIGAKAGIRQDNVKVMPLIEADVQNIYKKIIDITSGSTGSNEKILYALKRPDVAEDPFVKFNTDMSLLPSELASYYQKLNQYAWNLVELRAGIELDKAWRKEMYIPYMNQMAFLYPINPNSQDDMPSDAFKSFFGKQGTWNQFFNKYLNQILIKRGETYNIDPGYASKLNFSNKFLSTVSKLASISNRVLDLNDNFNINFNIKSRALSGDFGQLTIKLDSKTMTYDQTFPVTMGIVTGNFKNNTKMIVSVYDYQGRLKYKRIYSGEWGWLKFLQSARKLYNGSYRLTFNDNRKFYFDFSIDTGREEVDFVNNTLPNLTLPQNILK